MSYLRLLPDWVPHQATWMSLPRQPEIWGSGFNQVRELVIEIANTLVDFEPVVVLCAHSQLQILKRYFDNRITLLGSDSDELWLRDAAPVFAERSNRRLVALEFAAKRAGRSPLAMHLSKHMHLPLKRVPFFMLDGDFSVDGTGAMLLSSEGLLNSSRIQPEQRKIEQLLAKRFGITRPIWLPKALAYDKRKKLGNLARFIGPSKILLASNSNRGDASMSITLETYDQLTEGTLTDGGGAPYNVHQVYNPPPLRFAGRRICTSYMNFYIANGVVCIPAFYKPNYDKRALQLFRSLFPNYVIRQFQILPLLAQGGGIHCITRHLPVSRALHHKLLDEITKMEQQPVAELNKQQE